MIIQNKTNHYKTSVDIRHLLHQDIWMKKEDIIVED